MPVNPIESDAKLPDDLGELGEELTAQARLLEKTYPCQPHSTMVTTALQPSEAAPQAKWQRALLGMTLVCLMAAGIIAGKELLRWRNVSSQNELTNQPKDVTTVPSPPVETAQQRRAAPLSVADAPTRPERTNRFSVRELVASADMLEEQSEADTQLSDAEKIALLEKALDRYRSVIIYLQDEIKTRDEERAEQALQLRDLEQRLQLLENQTTP